jgi:hypothetical protein
MRLTPTVHMRQLRRGALGAAVVLAAAGLVTAGSAAQAAPAAPAAAPAAAAPTISIDARAGLATVPSTGLGVNDAVWDPALGSNSTSDLLGAAGVQMMRYPGGSYADIYHWQTNTADGGFVSPNTDFDTFMGSVRRVGAQPIIIANYGTGTAAEAAGWVRYANVTKGYGAKFWEIGNENYGNGHYGANWEADNHADKSPAQYARTVIEYADAMKAVDPTVKIGAVLTTPANWPDAVTADGDQANWNQTVLSIAGSKIDFVILHWYPPQTSAADVLTKPALVPDTMYLVRQQLAMYAGPNAANIGVAVTETSSVVAPNTQPGALYLADSFSSLLENGVFSVDWWNVHNGAGTVSTVDGQTDYGDWGLLSSAGCSTACEPALNTPFAPYYGLRMMSTFAHPGDQFVRAASGQPLVGAHAVRRPNGDLAVLLVNKDPANAQTVTLGYAGFTPAAAAPKVFSFTTGATALTSGEAGTAGTQTLPPYSLTTVLLHPAHPAGALPATPGQPTAGAVTDRGATLSWPASAPGSTYTVYQQAGASTVALGETSGTSLAIRDLSPGTRYVLNVTATDASGAESWASPPVEFTTGTPPKSSCAVHSATPPTGAAASWPASTSPTRAPPRSTAGR